MTAGWDSLIPRWFTRLDEKHRTPVNSIVLVAALVMALILLSMLGAEEQEARQLLTAASIAH
jgi:amino acid transporter